MSAQQQLDLLAAHIGRAFGRQLHLEHQELILSTMSEPGEHRLTMEHTDNDTVIVAIDGIKVATI